MEDKAVQVNKYIAQLVKMLQESKQAESLTVDAGKPKPTSTSDYGRCDFGYSGNLPLPRF